MNKGLEKDQKGCRETRHPYSKTVYRIVRLGNNKDYFDIEGEDLTYSQFGDLQGLQCNFAGDTPQYRLILRKLKKATELLKEVEKLNEF